MYYSKQRIAYFSSNKTVLAVQYLQQIHGHLLSSAVLRSARNLCPDLRRGSTTPVETENDWVSSNLQSLNFTFKMNLLNASYGLTPINRLPCYLRQNIWACIHKAP